MKLLALLFSLSSALFVTVLPRREECFHETGKAGDKVSTKTNWSITERPDLVHFAIVILVQSDVRSRGGRIFGYRCQSL